MIPIDLNNFLLTISQPIIHELNLCPKSKIAFEQACQADTAFSSYSSSSSRFTQIDELTKLIFNATQEFLLSYCKCCEIDKQHYQNNFFEYLDILLPVIFQNFHVKIDNQHFLQDYKNTTVSLLSHKITIEEAQKSLDYWRGVLDEQLVDTAHVFLLYRYIEQFMDIKRGHVDKMQL